MEYIIADMKDIIKLMENAVPVLGLNPTEELKKIVEEHNKIIKDYR